jgi:DNA repair photolyase
MDEPIKGRGAQFNAHNKFLKNKLVQEHIEGLDEEYIPDLRTEYFAEHPKKIVNKVDSPDIGLYFSINPYQGCEHGCIYCYARNSHQYWGFSAGIEFEQKIVIKKNAAELLEKYFDNEKYKPVPVMLSGNTDCYQPAEKKFRITRSLLEVFLKYKHPVSIITKNSLILRDLDILTELNKLNLVSANISVTSLDENLRTKLEPRTASGIKRMEAIAKLSQAGIPVRVMVAPVIPGLNNYEIPEILKRAAENGAYDASYIVVRLNGEIGNIFEDWVRKHFPDRAEKVLNQIREMHGGKLNDSRFGTRMKGEGEFAGTISQLFKTSFRKYFGERISKELDLTHFRRPDKGQLRLF